MPLSAREYRLAWQLHGAQAPTINGPIGAGTCVLETLSVSERAAKRAYERYIWLDDFGHAINYCRLRLLDDLTPPDAPDTTAGRLRRLTPRGWRQARAGFAPEDLAIRWAAAETGLATLLETFIAAGYSAGYSPALGARLLDVVNTAGLGLELANVRALPQELPALLAQVGARFAWWEDGIESAEQERQPFDFAQPSHRAILALRLRAANDE